MKRRQTVPKRWLILNGEIDLAALASIPPESGVLVLRELRPVEQRRLRHMASLKRVMIVQEAPRTAARVHNLRELTRARLQGARIVLISPMYRTRTHPDWKPLGRMRAAALARLADRSAVALGGMDERRFRRVQRLGFSGWAGISSWLKVTKVTDIGAKGVTLDEPAVRT